MANENLTTEEKARKYDSLIREYDKMAAKVRSLEVIFNPTTDELNQIKELKTKMAQLEKEAMILTGGGVFGR